MDESFSLYAHIPFCHHKCPYCDFNTYALSRIPEDEYIAALVAELNYRAVEAHFNGRVLKSIYFGGGTPSLLKPKTLGKLIDAACRHFPVDDLIEISVEVNPGNLNKESLANLRNFGVNRISFGVQSFNPETLKVLGRHHSPLDAEIAFDAARQAGFLNISLDLMYGAPDQTLDAWRADLDRATGLQPEHLSAYGLTIEKGTPFYQSYRRGVLKLPSEEQVIEMISIGNSFLDAAGYKRYEISNFSKNGKKARHNLAYWNGDDYLGLGAGAHSFCRSAPSSKGHGRRWSNFAPTDKYIREACARGKAEAWYEDLGLKEAMFEFFFLGLRKIEGVGLAKFKERFNLDLLLSYQDILKVLVENNLVVIGDEYLRLSEEGLLMADSVIESFSREEPPLAIGA